MTIITFDDMKQHLKRYLQQVKAGETLLVLEKGEPVAEMRPVAKDEARPRPFGLCKGEFQVPDNFDDPLPDELMALFEGR
jgi:antitoxin (DNA-binding transcriptional repressor) of toxin-antitoxin stability system